MCKNYQKLTLFALCFFLVACGNGDDSNGDSGGPYGRNNGGDVKTIISVGFATPESVVYDRDRDIYLVSNINGNPSEEDNNGYIVAIDPNDDNESEIWIQGGKDGATLNAPKGMAISGDTLWVADINTLRRFDSESGKALPPIIIEGSVFLNDVCAAEDGSVMVSDSGFNPDFSPSGTDAIYKVSSAGEIKPLVATTDLKFPNGVFCEQDGSALVVNFNEPGTVSRIDRNGNITLLNTLPKGKLDAIEKANDGTLYVSSWELGGVYSIPPGGEPEVLVEDIVSPADFALDSNRGLLVIPSFNKNEVHFVPLRKPE